MTLPTPSAVRVVRIYAEAQMLTSRGITPLDGGLKWPDKHPLTNDLFWWMDLTRYCQDAGTTILQVGASVSSGDGELSIAATYQTPDGLFAGFCLSGGSAGAVYVVRGKITFVNGAIEAWDVGLRMQAVTPPPDPNPSYLTNNRDILLLGGIPFPTGA